MQKIQETWVRSLSQEDPLEKEMTTHSSFLAWEIPGTEEPSGLQSMGSQTYCGHLVSLYIDMLFESESEVTQACPTL